MGYLEEEAELLDSSLIKRGPNKNLIAGGAIGAIVLIAVIVVVAVTAGGSSSADTSVDANEEKAAQTSTLKITGDFTDEGAQIAAQEAIASQLDVEVAVLESDYSYNIECDDSGITCTITITFVQEDSSPSIDIDEEALEDAVEVVEGVSGVDADHDFSSASTDEFDDEIISSTSTDEFDDEIISSTSTDEFDDEIISSTSTDEFDDEIISSTSTDSFTISFPDFSGEEMEGMEGMEGMEDMMDMLVQSVSCYSDFYNLLSPLYTQEEVTCEQQTAVVDAYLTAAKCVGYDGQENLDQFCAGDNTDDDAPDFLEVSCFC